MIDETKLVKQSTYAREIGVSREAVRQAIQAGRIPSVTIDGVAFVDKSRIDNNKNIK